MSGIKRTSEITILKDGTISFQCTSEMYNTTDAGGKAEDALKNGFVSLGDGNDYILTEDDKNIIKAKLICDSYYLRELNTLDITKQITFQFRDSNGNHTKYITLNPKSIEALEVFLNTYKLLLK